MDHYNGDDKLIIIVIYSDSTWNMLMGTGDDQSTGAKMDQNGEVHYFKTYNMHAKVYKPFLCIVYLKYIII